MNKFYLIIPVVLLAVFIARYSQFTNQFAQAELVKAHEKQLADAEVEKNKAEAIERATADARARKEAQDAEDARLEAEHLAKFEASKQKLADQTAKFQQEADSYAKQATDLQAQLDSLQATHEKASQELFDLQKQIELAKIDRRDADLEIQRTYDMVTQKVADSSLTYAPPPPTAEAK
jgi:chromosome segregation ATPase